MASAQTTASSQVSVASGLGNATGVAVDQFGNLYYTDSANGLVQELPGANGSNTTLVSASLNGGSQVAVDSSSNVYAASGAAGVVYKYAYANGALNANTPVSLGTGLGNITGVAVDLSGNIYAVDATNKQVVKITATAQTVLLSGLVAPKQIAVDTRGGVYVADSGANAIVYLPAGGTSVKLGTGLNAPSGVAVDPAGNLYIADTNNGVIKEIVYSAGLANTGQTTLPFTLSAPTSIAVDTRGSLYVAGGSSVQHLSIGAAYFGLVQVNQTSAVLPVNITFTSALTPATIKVVTTGLTGLDYLDAGSGSCKAGTAYSAGNSCTIDVTFTPQFPGPRYGAIVFYDASNKVLARTFVGGGGLGPMLTFDPATATTASVAPATATTPLYPNQTVTNPYPTPLDQPHGGRFDAAGNLFIADSLSDHIIEFPIDGSQPVIVNPAASMDDVAINGAGDLLMPAVSAGTVVMVPYENGTWNVADMVTLAKGFSKPRTIAVDVAGFIFLGDAGNKKLYKISPAGVSTQILTSIAASNTGVAVDLFGNLAETDSSSTGDTVWYAPATGAAPYTVGTGYNSPWGLAFDASGSLYVTDNGQTTNLRIPNEGGVLSTGHQQKVGGNKNFSLAIDQYGNIVTFPNISTAPSAGWNFNTISRSAPSAFFAGATVNASNTGAALTISNTGNQTPAYNAGLVNLGDVDDFLLNANVTGEPSYIPSCTFLDAPMPGLNCYLGVQLSSTALPGVRTEVLQLPTQLRYTPQAKLTATLSGTSPTQSAGLAISASPSAPQPTQAITVKVSAASAATGAVTLLVDGALTQTQELSSGSASFVLSSGLSAGAHILGATYAGDSSYAPVVTPVTTTVTVAGAAATLTLSSSAKDITAGQTLTLIASAGGVTGLPLPTGKITFLDGATVLGAGTLQSGVAAISVSTLAVGAHTITFTYPGDTVYASGTSAPMTVTVGTYTPTSITLSVVPVQPTVGYSYGTKVTATAVVTAGSGTPTGSVLFSLDGVVQIVALTGSTATLTLNPSAGLHSLTASYTGDANFDASVASTSFTTLQAATSTTLSLSSTNVAAGSNVVLKSVVSSAVSQPTGTVVFRNGVVIIGTATLDGTGTATLTTYKLPAGSDLILASYEGDSNNQASTSSTIKAVVTSNATSVTVSSNPVIVLYVATSGASATLTANIASTAPAGVVATMGGSVTFSANGVLLGTSSVVSGSATYAWSNPAPGAIYTITAAYSGDNYYSPSSQSSFRIFVAPSSGVYPGDYTVSMNPNPLVVTVGTPTKATLSIVTTSSYFGYVQASCSNLPVFADCEIAPNPVTLDGTTTPQTMTLTVNAQAGFQVSGLRRKDALIQFSALFLTPLLSMLGFASFGRGRRLLRSAGMRGLLGIVLLCMFGASLTACGSHLPIATPPGTYTVNIVTTGTGGINHVTPTQMTFQ
ncbi:Ig-like domain repeat protein [Granulicella rosea]|uniref:Ig-like domain repeat protein n=1 Tax=Granulicella rosea TaxID=474952 RepID=UPI001595137D|nr:Ig-like domain repeat protein [Granulicella rosea]